MKYENKKKAARALAALRGTPTCGQAAAYYNHSNRSDWQECPEAGIFELLCDLRHLCDALNLEFAILNSQSGYYHRIER